ncbi:hypothetical protein H6776_02935 [Candidatus Nomurabacteria bacterium]|nr:hypothetical protein [Candidatus Nomurabacteria bacterium]
MDFSNNLPSHVCRTMFCERCFHSGELPKEGHKVLLFGQSRKIIHYSTIEALPATPALGYTPHIISNIRTYIEHGVEMVSFLQMCGIEDCGWELSTLAIDIKTGELVKSYYAHFLEKKFYQMTRNEFMHFINHKDIKMHFKTASLP